MSRTYRGVPPSAYGMAWDLTKGTTSVAGKPLVWITVGTIWFTVIGLVVLVGSLALLAYGAYYLAVFIYWVCCQIRDISKEPQ